MTFLKREYDRVGVTLGLQRMQSLAIQPGPTANYRPRTALIFCPIFYPCCNSGPHVLWNFLRSALSCFCLLVCLLPGSGLSTSPFLWLNPCGSTQYARPGPTPPIAQCPPSPPCTPLACASLLSSWHGVWYCCGSVKLMWHLSLARDHVLSPPPNKRCVTGLLGP